MNVRSSKEEVIDSYVEKEQISNIGGSLYEEYSSPRNKLNNKRLNNKEKEIEVSELSGNSEVKIGITNISPKNVKTAQPSYNITQSINKETNVNTKKLNFNKVSNSEFCKEHKFNTLHIICSDCNKILCDKCLFLKHKNHDTQELGYLSQENVKKWLDGIYNCSSKLLEINLPKFKEKIESHQETLRSVYEMELQKLEYFEFNLIEGIKELFNNIKEILNHKYEKLDVLRKQASIQFNDIEAKLNDIKFYKEEMQSGKSKVIEANYYELISLKTELDKNYDDCYYWYNTNRGIFTYQLGSGEEVSNLSPINSIIKNLKKEVNLQSMKDSIDSMIKNSIKNELVDKPITTKLICQPIHPIDNNIGMIVNLENEIVRNDKLSNWKVKPYGKLLYLNSFTITSGGLENNYAIKSISIYKNTYFNNIHDPSNYGKGSSSLVKHIQKTFNLFSSATCFELIPMKKPRAGHCFILFSSLLIAISGVFTNTCEVFDYETNNWRMISSVSEPRIESSSIVINDSFLYLFFGINSDNTFLTTIERLNLSNIYENPWDSIVYKMSNKEICMERTNCGILKSDRNKIMILGGIDREKNSLNQVLEYDLQSNVFNLMPEFIIPISFDFNSNFVEYYNTLVSVDTNGNIWTFNTEIKKFFIKPKYIQSQVRGKGFSIVRTKEFV